MCLAPSDMSSLCTSVVPDPYNIMAHVWCGWVGIRGVAARTSGSDFLKGLLLKLLSPNPSEEGHLVWCHCPHVVSWLSLTDHFGLFSPLPVLCLPGDDCLRSECVLQLPSLARRGQQRGHESDGWGLLLSQLCCGLSHGKS